jgi:hypothetical protein
MATNKKATKRKKPSSRPDAPKKPKTSKKKVPTKAAKKMSAPKKKKPKTAAKKRAAPRRKKAAKSQAAVPPPKTFAEKIRDRAPTTEVWYRVDDVLSHGVILGPGAAGNVMVVSNGVVSGVPAEELFETQADAAARLDS